MLHLLSVLTLLVVHAWFHALILNHQFVHFLLQVHFGISVPTLQLVYLLLQSPSLLLQLVLLLTKGTYLIAILHLLSVLVSFHRHHFFFHDIVRPLGPLLQLPLILLLIGNQLIPQFKYFILVFQLYLLYTVLLCAVLIVLFPDQQLFAFVRQFFVQTANAGLQFLYQGLLCLALQF